MRTGLRIAALASLAVLCLPGASLAADTQAPPHRHKKAPKKPDPPKLFSGPMGPLREQIPLNDMPAIAPEVSYEDGQLTIVALNSTLGDILRAVSKQTGAEMDVPASATDRVVTRLGPGPARDVMAELLNGSKFNYVLLGSPKDVNVLTRIVLVANPEGPGAGPGAAAQAKPQAQPLPVIGNVPPNAPPLVVPDEPQAEAEDNTPEDTPEPNAAEADTPVNPGQPGIKTPQQLLQEMQQRQIQLQQQQQQQQVTGQPPTPGPVPPPNLPVRPQSEQQ